MFKDKALLYAAVITVLFFVAAKFVVLDAVLYDAVKYVIEAASQF